MTIGSKIRVLRKALGLTQTELGERLGVKTNAVSKWECGRVEDIPMSKIKAMSVLFNVPTSYLIDADDKPTTVSSDGLWEIIHNNPRKLKFVEWIAGLDERGLDRIEKLLDVVEMLPKE
ncbi:helix-turn-helix domain-containing protein [Anaerotruncus rubiinfantis]|uniref:helix-turn-helix domain-containing protein n=1 Tax=Anaerotruncus rubiinfantis TaxID=1720200 RepID=UPI0008322FF6|nr:helix-turn-helix transcriptional regulator [Anaerotruncus rubiinfantis]